MKLNEAQREMLERMIRKEFESIDRDSIISTLQEMEVVEMSRKLPVSKEFIKELENDLEYAF